MTKGNKKIFFFFLAVLIASNLLFASFNNTAAAVTVEDVLNFVSNTWSAVTSSISAIQTTYLAWKESIGDAWANYLAKAMIRTLTNMIIAWIQGDDISGPLFVQNLEDELVHQADVAGANFIKKLRGINLCGDFSATLQVILTRPAIKERLECTISQGIDNVQHLFDFYNDFEKGGWGTFFQITENENNYYGVLAASLDIKLGGESLKQTEAVNKFLAQAGFKAYEKKQDVDDPDTCEVGPDGNSVCLKKTAKVTKTPGRTVADLLSKGLGSGIDTAVVADEIDEAIAEIILALTQNLIQKSQGGGEGLLDSSLSNQPPLDNPQQSSSFLYTITDAISRGEQTLGIVQGQIDACEE